MAAKMDAPEAKGEGEEVAPRQRLRRARSTNRSRQFGGSLLVKSKTLRASARNMAAGEDDDDGVGCEEVDSFCTAAMEQGLRDSFRPESLDGFRPQSLTVGKPGARGKKGTMRGSNASSSSTRATSMTKSFRGSSMTKSFRGSAMTSSMTKSFRGSLADSMAKDLDDEDDYFEKMRARIDGVNASSEDTSDDEDGIDAVGKGGGALAKELGRRSSARRQVGPNPYSFF